MTEFFVRDPKRTNQRRSDMRSFLLLLFAVLVMAFAGPVYVEDYGFVRVENRSNTQEFTRLFNRYQERRLTRLVDRWMDGEVDTTLSTADMLHRFVSTSTIGNNVKLEIIPTPKGTGGYYKPADSTIVIAPGLGKHLSLYILLHELTHAIQYQFDIATVSREGRIVDEIFADIQAVRMVREHFGETPILQPWHVLMWYLDPYDSEETLEDHLLLLMVFSIAQYNKLAEDF